MMENVAIFTAGNGHQDAIVGIYHAELGHGACEGPGESSLALRIVVRVGGHGTIFSTKTPIALIDHSQAG
jgi:hypothetical protein